MRHLTHRLAAAAAATTLLGLGLAAGTPARASVSGPPCYGPTCVGKSAVYLVNRDGVACMNDAVKLQSVHGNGDGTNNSIALYWSSYCHANWVEWTGDALNPVYWGRTADGHEEPARGPRTYMLDGTQQAQGCVRALTPHVPDTCTAWW